MELRPSAARITARQGVDDPTGIEDVPDVSAEWYLDVVEHAAAAPLWFQSFVGFYTEAAIVLLAGLMVLCWWRARARSAEDMARALLTPVGVVVPYLVSEVVKSVYQVERPCRALGDVVTIAECPPPGDWSIPSNHSVIAGASAVGLALAWRLLVVPAVLIAVTAAASRVFVGAHYPHDAIVGLLFGAGLAFLIALVLVRPVTTLTGTLRRHGRIGPLLATDAVRRPEEAVTTRFPRPLPHRSHPRG